MAKGLGRDQFRDLRIINRSFLLYDFPLIGTEEPLALAFFSSFLDGQIEDLQDTTSQPFYIGNISYSWEFRGLLSWKTLEGCLMATYLAASLVNSTTPPPKKKATSRPTTWEGLCSLLEGYYIVSSYHIPNR